MEGADTDHAEDRDRRRKVESLWGSNGGEGSLMESEAIATTTPGREMNIV